MSREGRKESEVRIHFAIFAAFARLLAFARRKVMLPA